MTIVQKIHLQIIFRYKRYHMTIYFPITTFIMILGDINRMKIFYLLNSNSTATSDSFGFAVRDAGEKSETVITPWYVLTFDKTLSIHPVRDPFPSYEGFQIPF